MSDDRDSARATFGASRRRPLASPASSASELAAPTPSPSSWRRPSSSGSSCPATIGTATPLSTTGTQVPQRIGRLVSEVQPERPSAVRELGLGALQAWQALSEAQGRGRGKVDVAILFTDIVGFSSWALEAGDEAALELLRQVAAAEDAAISEHGGSLVKRLGDGAMAVFRARRARRFTPRFRRSASLAGIEVNGHTPELRAGVHLGRPRRVGGDYLGVDVNIAARVGEAAKGGEVLVSESGPRGAGPGGLQVRPQPAAERDAEPRGTSRSAASPSADGSSDARPRAGRMLALQRA